MWLAKISIYIFINTLLMQIIYNYYLPFFIDTFITLYLMHLGMLYSF